MSMIQQLTKQTNKQANNVYFGIQILISSLLLNLNTTLLNHLVLDLIVLQEGAHCPWVVMTQRQFGGEAELPHTQQQHHQRAAAARGQLARRFDVDKEVIYSSSITSAPLQPVGN